MIKHIVMFRLKDFAEGVDKKENARKIKAMLDELPTKMEEIKHYEIGVNITDSERASDIVVISSFDSMEALKAYSQHPEHIKAVEFIKKVNLESRVVDFEC